MEQIIAEIESEDGLEGYHEFGKKWSAMVQNDKKNAFENTKKLFDEWHKAALENRIREIVKNDGNDDLLNKD
ncbi:hypothetical protein FAZ15_11600 [Sphingobacterium olei]|uniref:Uncharacterized protein n=1 Tax=Sphingobacterium olei TaxID=2571155 RepID=A0A4U0P0S5_9SPHI|nr:hypothetical protein [Sphingobacterium olei]TJZ60630.1 hypothetical protein FAZ15_11600 [Sphingobacterium olei]